MASQVIKATVGGGGHVLTFFCAAARDQTGSTIERFRYWSERVSE